MDHEFVILGDGFLLRPIKECDLEAVRLWRNANREFFFDQSSIEADQQLQWFEKYLENNCDYMFIIEKTGADHKAIGNISLYNIDYASRKAEFGRLIIGDTESRGKGIAIKAVNEICRFGFDILGLNLISLEVFSDNEKAVSVYQRAGFRTGSQSFRDSRKILVMNLESSDIMPDNLAKRLDG